MSGWTKEVILVSDGGPGTGGERVRGGLESQEHWSSGPQGRKGPRLPRKPAGLA